MASEGKTTQPKPREKKKWEKDYELPPCRVCGARGTGYHYGVNTCEPCKGFFRRSLPKHTEYVCRKGVKCHPQRARGNWCAYCRFQKCLQVGMSRDGIRNGRYTVEKRVQDTEEVKEIESAKALTCRLLEEERRRPSLEKFVTTIVQTRHKHAAIWNTHEMDLLRLNIRFLNNTNIENSIAQDARTVREGEGDRLEFYNLSMQGQAKVMRRVIKFAKGIPGYRDLNMQDQVALLQECTTDMRMVSNYQFLYANEEGWAECANIDMSKLLGPELGQGMQRVCERLHSLSLKPEEVAMLTALVLFSTDRRELANPRLVSTLQQQVLDALHWLLQRNHPDDKLVMAKLTWALTELRTVAELSVRAYRDVMKSEVVTVPQIMRELIPVKEH